MGSAGTRRHASVDERKQEGAARTSETAGTRTTAEAYLTTRARGDTGEDRNHSKAQGAPTEGSYVRGGRPTADFPTSTKRPAGQESGLGGALQLRADRGIVSPRADLMVINS